VVIFHDSTLRLIAEQRRGSMSGLIRIGRIGGAKLERYGAEVAAGVWYGAQSESQDTRSSRRVESDASTLRELSFRHPGESRDPALRIKTWKPRLSPGWLQLPVFSDGFY
jgi:HRDC domain